MDPGLDIFSSGPDVLQCELSRAAAVLMRHLCAISHDFFVILVHEMRFLIRAWNEVQANQPVQGCDDALDDVYPILEISRTV